MKLNYPEIFKALGDENRLEILSLLSNGQTCGCTLIGKLPISQPTLSYHLRTLKEAGIISSKKERTWNKHFINETTIDQLISYLTKLKGTTPCK